jgi:hypothetical protein
MVKSAGGLYRWFVHDYYKHKDSRPLGYDDVSLGEWFQTFRDVVPSLYGIKHSVVDVSKERTAFKASGTFHLMTQCHSTKPEPSETPLWEPPTPHSYVNIVLILLRHYRIVI